MADNEMMTGFLAGKADDNNRRGDMWGGDGWWAIILFAMIFGWGRGGFGGFGGAESPALNGALTRADMFEGFNHNELQSAVRGVQQGICDSTYAITNAVNNGFHGVDNAICGLGTAMQQGFNNTNVTLMQGQHALSSQLANCCCENREAIAQVRYDMASQACETRNLVQNTTRDILESNNANTRAILDFLTQDKIATLQAENQGLKFAASQAAQNSYFQAAQEAQTAELVRRIAPSPVPAYSVPAPYPYGCGNGCGHGCGNSCGC